MKCPKDSTELKPITYEADVQVDACDTCGGMWLDQGELERVESNIVNDYSEALKRVPRGTINAMEMARQEAAPDRTCPKCGGTMEKREHGYCSHRGTNNNQYPWWMQEMAARFDLVMGMPEITPAEKETLKAYFAFCVNMLQDDDFMPPRRTGVVTRGRARDGSAGRSRTLHGEEQPGAANRCAPDVRHPAGERVQAAEPGLCRGRAGQRGRSHATPPVCRRTPDRDG